MSVAGDIIDDLAIDPTIKLGAVTGICGALAIGVFVTIGLSGAASAEEFQVTKTGQTVLPKSSGIQTGGAPLSRE